MVAEEEEDTTPNTPAAGEFAEAVAAAASASGGGQSLPLPFWSGSRRSSTPDRRARRRCLALRLVPCLPRRPGTFLPAEAHRFAAPADLKIRLRGARLPPAVVAALLQRALEECPLDPLLMPVAAVDHRRRNPFITCRRRRRQRQRERCGLVRAEPHIRKPGEKLRPALAHFCGVAAPSASRPSRSFAAARAGTMPASRHRLREKLAVSSSASFPSPSAPPGGGESAFPLLPQRMAAACAWASKGLCISMTASMAAQMRRIGARGSDMMIERLSRKWDCGAQAVRRSFAVAASCCASHASLALLAKHQAGWRA